MCSVSNIHQPALHQTIKVVTTTHKYQKVLVVLSFDLKDYKEIYF